MKSKFPMVYHACIPAFDRALSVLYTDLKKAGVQLSTYLELYKDELGLVCEEEDLTTVQLHAADLAVCSQAVCRLVNGSKVGSLMLAGKMAQLTAENFSKEVTKVVDKLREMPQVTAEKVLEISKECDGLIAGVKGRSKEIRDREVAMRFLGSDIVVVCPDLSSECRYKISHVIKELAWGRQGGLAALEYETWVRDAPAQTAKSPVDDELLKNFKQARRLCADLVKDSSIESFAEMAAVLQKRSQALCSIDATFVLELAWLGQAGEALEGAVTVRALACLPTENKLVSFTEALVSLSALRKSEMVRRSTVETQERLSSIEGVVHDMSRGIAPKHTAELMQGFYQDVLNRSVFFFTLPEAAASSLSASATAGKAALEGFVASLRQKQSADEQVSLADVERTRPFWFALSPASLKAIREVTKYAAEKVHGSHVIRKAEDRDFGKTAGSKTKRAKVSDDAAPDTTRENILKFFS